mmetsp:Transcript_37011/g.75462  ORF Transcript_37011/g.75462 Transcript_37011/m.75462 type:complete len:312 (-) Transcript_37011:1133-2068(-)
MMLASISNRSSYPISAIWMMMVFIQLLVLLSSVDSFLIQPSHVQRRHVTCTHKRITTTVLESSPSTISDTDPASEREDMPWGNVQKWALEDNIGKFTVTIPSSKKRVALWRTMAREVTELAGYPIPFLVKMHKRSLNTDDSSNNTSASTSECPGVLPMVDDFEFASNGGVVGSAYGIPGIADGTRINTPPLVSVEQTIPLGYVTTEEDDLGVAFSYELGVCASSSVYSLDGTDRSSALLSARRLVLEGAADSSKRLVNIAKDAQVTGSGLLSDVESNRDLAYLGGATAMLLASASAVGMLSHHLTVNVFWV